MSDHRAECQECAKTRLSRRKGSKYLISAALAALAPILAGKQAKAGWRACSVSGCPCQEFTGNQNLCQNCGHQYSQHW